MRICVYAAASNKIDKLYIEELELLGEQLAKAGHSLVFGGGETGLMGAIARGFTKGDGNILGVTPRFIQDFESPYDKCTNLIQTETMAERKVIMEGNSDVFLIAPGGVGTFDEFFQILTLKQLNKLDCPIILYNLNDFYSSLDAYLSSCFEKGFMANTNELYTMCNTNQEVLGTLKQFEKK